MLYKIIKLNVDLISLEDEINTNVKNVKIQSNKRILMIQSKIFSHLIENILDELKLMTGENFNTYVKTIFTFTENNNEEIKFTKQLKNDINLISKYSFIFFTKSLNSKILINSQTGINEISVDDGDLLLFKTENFIGSSCSIPNRIGIYGSITNFVDDDKLNKTII